MGNERVSKPVGRTVARVSVEEHMANYRTARALKETLEILERAALLSILALVKARAQRRYPHDLGPASNAGQRQKRRNPSGARQTSRGRRRSLVTARCGEAPRSLLALRPSASTRDPLQYFNSLQGKENSELRKDSRAEQQRQEVRGEERSGWGQRDRQKSREVAVEHRGDERDTRRNQRSDFSDCASSFCETTTAGSVFTCRR